LSISPFAASGIEAADNAQVSTPEVDYTYGEGITFTAKLQSEEPVEEAHLFVRAEGQTEAWVIPADLDSQGNLKASYDVNQYPLAVFSEVFYRFRIAPKSGDPIQSQEFSFFYEDNRFDWQTLVDEPFEVHWYLGDTIFAQEVLNTAQAGRLRVQSFLPLSTPNRIDIYVYDSAQDLQSTLNLSGQTWIAGHADPDLGMIMVSLPPGPEQQLEMERQIPHELMHVMLYETTGGGYDNLPAWFIEGLASISELYPNPDYAVLLDNAHQNDGLIPIIALCNVFPRDASSALLAYAESASFTRYLFSRFGTPGLEELRLQYAAGLACENGAEQAFEVTLNRLEFQWRRETFTTQGLSNMFAELGPWVLILVAILAAPVVLVIRGLQAKPYTY
jgi:hypothetical protein